MPKPESEMSLEEICDRVDLEDRKISLKIELSMIEYRRDDLPLLFELVQSEIERIEVALA
jgi:glutamate formiminotransferase